MFGYRTLTAFAKFRKVLSLFKKERRIIGLFADITGDVSDGFRKEVKTSIDAKSEKIVSDIRSHIHN